MNILVTGSHGYIGSGIVKKLSLYHTVYYLNRSILDLQDRDSVIKWFIKTDQYFDTVIHTAINGGNRLKKEDSSVLDGNIKMYLNILECRTFFNKFISIGSGAEIYSDSSFYGLSKKFIDKSMSDKNLFYNLRLYGLFDEHELDRRFIKSNLIRYINKENLIIHKNKYMDFIYFNDFLSIIDKYLIHDNLPKTIDCVYKTKYTLMDIAGIIQKLDFHKVDVELLEHENDSDYTGEFVDLDIEYIGLQNGITNTYRKLYNEKNMVCPK